MRSLSLVLLALALPGMVRGWEVRIDGSGTAFDQAHAVAIDPNGDVVAAGRSSEATRFFDLVVTKRSGVTGAQMWLRYAFGNRSGFGVNEGAWAVALTPSGTAFAAGYLDYQTVLRQFAVLRLEAVGGNETWRALFGEGRSYYSIEDEAWSVAVDATGDVLAAGVLVKLVNGSSIPFGVVMKLSGGSGAPLWTVSNGLPPTRAIAVDAAGDVAAVGGDIGPFVVIKLAGSNGQERWRRDLPIGYGQTVAIDASGDVLAGGSRSGGAYVIKLDGVTGGTAWERDVVPAGGSALVREVVAHASGDVIAAAELGDQLAVMRLDAATGADVWPPFFASGTGTFASATDVALDSAGGIVVSGSISNAASSGDLAVLKLDPQTGLPLWRRELDEAAANDFADDVAVDADGNVVVIGALGTDFAVVKLRGSDGLDFPPCGDVDGDADIDSNDVFDLRYALAGLPPRLAAPDRCSVIGGPEDCDLADAVVIRRSQLGLLPGLRSVCAGAVD